MKESNILVKRNLIFFQDDKVKKEISIQISHPFWVTVNEEAACSIKILGLYENLADIRGVDFYQALEMSINFINDLLAKTAESKNAKILWPDGELFEYVLVK